jgi:prephenate dehydratase
MQYESAAAMRLKVVAEADPGALVRVLQFFQVRSVIPRRTIVRRLGAELLEIEIDVDAADCAPEVFRVVIAKINELPIVLDAVLCD